MSQKVEYVVASIHRMSIAILLIAVCTTTLLAAVASGIKVVSDKSVDSSSVENIIKDICKPGMSDQEKAEAVFEYVVTHFYHL